MRMSKELQQIDKGATSLEKWAKYMKRQFSEEQTGKASKHVKKHVNSTMKGI